MLTSGNSQNQMVVVLFRYAEEAGGGSEAALNNHLNTD